MPQNNLREILTGEHAFYNDPNYLENTRTEFRAKKLLPSYEYNTESKTMRIAKQIFSIIFFPIGIYNLLHAIVGYAIVPAAVFCPFNRSNINLENEEGWRYKRINIMVDGYNIDAMIVGKESTFNNGRWTVACGGNGECYESMLNSGYFYNDFKRVIERIESNAILFNYPGVNDSSGFPNRQAMAKAHRAILKLLEDEEHGIRARQIIGYGHSIGGGVQGDALNNYELHTDSIRYVFVKSRTFSDLSTEVNALLFRPLGFLVKLLGWNMETAASSKKLHVPEIIFQTIRNSSQDYEEIHDSSSIVQDDGVILRDATLAKALLDDNQCPKGNKIFIGTRDRHNYGIQDVTFLAEAIEDALSIEIPSN